MMGTFRRNRTNRLGGYLLVGVLFLVVVALVCTLLFQKEPGSPVIQNPTQGPADSTPVPTPEPVTYEEITLLSVGDLMYHGPQLTGAYDASSQTYDFTGSMQYVKDIVSAADYAVANLETTLNGGTPTSYPRFNSPDSVLDSLQYAGFDLLLLSNNHSYDTGSSGLIRTWEKVREKGFDVAGSAAQESAKSYFVKNIGGVQIGFLDYGYESGKRDGNDIFLNGIRVKEQYASLLDTFNYDRQDEFFSEVSFRMKEMKEAGADMIVLYIHWGDEYHLEPNSKQKAIAQGLCNLGVDVIIGSHPHVIQPMEILEAEQGEHQTICFYSMGNFLSNQNRRTLTEAGYLSTQMSVYTENGLMVQLTIRKYSTGEVVVSKIQYIPTWVHRYTKNGKLAHEIIPLPQANEAPEQYGLNGSSFGADHAAAALAVTGRVFEEAVAAYNQSVVFPVSDAA